MRSSGPVTLDQVEDAIKILGGQGTWGQILAEVTKLRNGDYSHYLDKGNYEKTAFQVIQKHCPEYKKYRGSRVLRKLATLFVLSEHRQK